MRILSSVTEVVVDVLALIFIFVSFSFFSFAGEQDKLNLLRQAGAGICLVLTALIIVRNLRAGKSKRHNQKLETQETSMVKKRSIGVTVFGIIMVIFYGCGLLVLPMVFLGSLMKRDFSFFKDYVPLQTIFMETYWLIMGLGILRLKSLARLLTIIGALFVVVEAILCNMGPYLWYPSARCVLTSLKPPHIYGLLIILAWYVLLIYFFTRPSVKEQFKK